MSTPQTPSITSANVQRGPTVTPKTISSPAPPNVGGSQAATSLPVPPIPEAQLPVFDTMKIVARPLSDPDFLSLRPKNPMHQLYWANRGHQNGIRVGYRTAQQFRLANKNDVINCPDFMIDPSGQIVFGDLVCMIIGKNAYQGALLSNHNKGIRRVNKFGQLQQNWKQDPNTGELIPVPENEYVDVVAATVSEVRASPTQRSKIKAFVPGAAELNAAIDSSSQPEKP